MAVYRKFLLVLVLSAPHVFLIIHSADNDFSPPIDCKEFSQAVKQGDYFLVNRELQTGCIDVDAHIHFGKLSYPPLMVATENFDVPMMELLLNFGARANVKDLHGNTPLHQLASASYIHRDKVPLILSCIRFFIASGVNKNASNEFGETPLMEASKWKYSDLCLEALMIQDEKQKQKALYQSLLFYHPDNIAVLLFHDTQITHQHINLLSRECAKPKTVVSTIKALRECGDLIEYGTQSKYFVIYWLKRFQEHQNSRKSVFSLLKNREIERKR